LQILPNFTFILACGSNHLDSKFQCLLKKNCLILFKGPPVLPFSLMNKLSCTDSVLFILLISFAELQSEKEELRKKYIHVMQILESEKTAKWQLLQQCEEQGQLVSSLKAEVAALRKQKTAEAREEESEEIRNIKKVTCTSSLWLHGTIVQYNSCNEEFSLLGCKLILFLSSFLNNNCFQFENAKIFSSKNLITGMYLHLGVV